MTALDHPQWHDLVGILSPGLGEGQFFTQLDWVVKVVDEKIGFKPHPGTFNLHMGGERWPGYRQQILDNPGIDIPPPDGFCGAKCFPVLVEKKIKGAAIFPMIDDYPDDKLEIIAPVSIRDALDLDLGQQVAFRINFQPTETIGVSQDVSTEGQMS